MGIVLLLVYGWWCHLPTVEYGGVIGMTCMVKLKVQKLLVE
jgi:hypothetical protein